MSEILIVIGMALSGLFLTDPFYGGGLTKSGLAKGVVLVFVGGPLLLHYVNRLFADAAGWRRSLGAVTAAWWPVMVLALLITAGSVYARQANKINETFLNMGLGMFFLPLFALAVDSSARKALFLRGLLVVYLLTALSMFGVAAARFHVLHEQIFWAVPVGMYFLAAHRVSPVKVVAGLALTGLSLLAFKNTTFLLVLMCLAAWVVFLLLRMKAQPDRLKALVTIYFSALAVLALAVAGAVGWWLIRDTLPHGNASYRLEMYGIALRRFLASPVWGSLFTESSVNYFGLYKIPTAESQYLPTHSDILDILAHGGLTATALWLATVWRILGIAASAFSVVVRGETGSQDCGWRWLLVLGLVQVGAVVTYAVNPPLIRLVDGLWIWGGAGVLWALQRHLAAATKPVAARSPLQAAPLRRWGIKPAARRLAG